jgi:hypothetical protein
MKSFLVSKNYPFNTRPWSTLTRASLFLGDSLIVRDSIMNKVICLLYRLRKVIGKKMARWVCTLINQHHETLLIQKLTKRRATKCAEN